MCHAVIIVIRVKCFCKSVVNCINLILKFSEFTLYVTVITVKDRVDIDFT